MVKLTLIYWRSGELNYDVVSVNKCDESCNTIEDPIGKICFPNKVKDVNLKKCNIFERAKGINEPNKLPKHISCKCRYDFYSRYLTLHVSKINCM